MTRFPRGVVTSVLLGLLTLTGLPLVIAPSAAAADTAPGIRVVIEALAPASPGPDDVMRVKGRVINIARTPFTNVSVELRRSSAPLTTRPQVQEAIAAPADQQLADVPLPGTRVDVTDTLAPNERKPFTITIPVRELGFTSPGSYALSVDALGLTSGVDTIVNRKGEFRTLLPWLPDGTGIAPVRVVWLWPLADWPARNAQGALLDERTPEEMAEGGRLAELVGIGSKFSSTVSWVVDPALLQTARAMQGGYEVVQGDSTVPGEGEQTARRWLADVRSATQGRTLRVLPYADVDAAALTRAGMTNDVVRAVTRAPAIATAALARRPDGDLSWAPFGRMDRPTLDVLASAGTSTIVLSGDALPATPEGASSDGLATAALPTSVGSIRAVLADPVLSSLVSTRAVDSSAAIGARQQFLAETAALAQSLPPEQGMRSVVIAPSVRWNPTASVVTPLLRATRTASWLRTQTLDQLLDEPVPSTSRQRGGYGPRARDAELPAEYMVRVARVSDELDAFTSIIDDPTGISEPFSEALLRAESSAWRTQPETGSRLLGSISQSLRNEMGRVRVLSEGTITFSGDVGRVPVTIQNDLDRSVTVGLTLRGNPALRLSSEPLTGVRIEPGRLASVDIDARVIGGDPLAVDVQLLGAEGQDYGPPASITVASTAYARAAAWVVAAAFLAIAVFVVVGITRRIRKARRTPSRA